MSTKYFALLTQLGADKLANAAALGTKIEITHMAIGDGGGKLPTPDTKQTKLVNEKRRAAINTLSIDPKNTNQIIAEQVIPENEGGWWIREIGLFDKDGILIAVGNCAETYKPQLQEGSGRTQTIRMILIVSSANAVTLKVDPSVILATREYVDDSIKKHANSRNHPDATLQEKGFVILSSAVDSNSETHAATPKAVKAAYDFAKAADNNANGRVPVGRKVNGKALLADIALNAGDVGAYSKGETDTKVGEATKQANAANANANTRVPSTRKVNGKALSADIALNAADVGAYNTTQTDAKVSEAKSLANTANQNAANANNNANTRLEKNKNGSDIPNKNEFVKNLGLAGTVELAENALPRTGGIVDGSLAVKQWLSTFDRVYVASNNGFAGVELSDSRTSNTATLEMNGTGGVYISQKTNGQVNVNHIPKTNGILLNSADIIQSVGDSVSQVMSQKSVTDALDNRLEKSRNGADIPNKPEFVRNIGLVGTVKLAENALPRTGGVVDGSIAVKQWLSTYDRVYVAANNGFAGVELSDTRNKNTVTIEMNGAGGAIISQKTNGQVNVNHIPKTNGTLLNSADAEKYVTSLRLSTPREITTKIDEWLDFSTNEFVVGVRLSRTPGGGVWVIERLRVANLQIMRNGGWINVTQ